MSAQIQNKAIIEALLFVSEEPLTVYRLSKIMEQTESQVEKLLSEIQQELSCQNRGIQLYHVNGGYKMGTPPELAEYVEKLFSSGSRPTLSRAALETIAIIAYKQPITRVEIEAIRGVSSGGVLDNLLKRKMIKVTGRKESPGRPLMYGTTSEFLKYFGLNKLEELPPLKDEEIS